MYAIIAVGGKQYKVEVGETLNVEKQEGQKADVLTFDKVLLVGKDTDLDIGRPYVKGASVSAEILGQIRAKKVISYKYLRRKSRDWKKGHRQNLTRLMIKDIKVA
ncbi:MAG: 50S ribosomal protein L21 [Candidatus Omnitrophota bacterium]|jgi:large subunit ribosomal protein L21